VSDGVMKALLTTMSFVRFTPDVITHPIPGGTLKFLKMGDNTPASQG
jgi:hypothetical protein